MKRLISVIIALLLMLSFTACEKSSDGIPAAIPESRIYVFGDSDSIIDQSVILLDGEGNFSSPSHL